MKRLLLLTPTKPLSEFLKKKLGKRFILTVVESRNSVEEKLVGIGYDVFIIEAAGFKSKPITEYIEQIRKVHTHFKGKIVLLTARPVKSSADHNFQVRFGNNDELLLSIYFYQYLEAIK